MKKILSKKGFTLVEALIAVAILAIFVSMAIVGTSALFGTGEQMMTVSKAAVLGSDVMKIVTNEVRFGENFSATTEEDGTTTFQYNSTAYGDNCTIGIDDFGHLLIISNTLGTAGGEKTFRPIGTAAYDEVRIKAITFDVTTESERSLVSCTLSITSDGTNTLWEKSVTLVPLYQKATA